MNNEGERLDDQVLSNLLDTVWEEYCYSVNLLADQYVLRVHKDGSLQALLTLADKNNTVWFPAFYDIG